MDLLLIYDLPPLRCSLPTHVGGHIGQSDTTTCRDCSQCGELELKRIRLEGGPRVLQKYIFKGKAKNVRHIIYSPF